MFTNKKIILFDMDGTLIDSVGIWNEVDRQLLENISLVPIKEDIQVQRDTLLRKYSTYQNPYYEYCRELKEKYQAKESVEEIVHLRYQIASSFLENQVDYKKDADTLIKALKQKGYRLGITTTTKASNMEVYRFKNKNIISKARLDDYFDFILTREDVKKIKPHPEIYYKVMEDYGYQKEEYLIFEDALVGIEAARNAGIEVVAMYDRYSSHERDEINEKANYHFDSFTEVLDKL